MEILVKFEGFTAKIIAGNTFGHKADLPSQYHNKKKFGILAYDLCTFITISYWDHWQPAGSQVHSFLSQQQLMITERTIQSHQVHTRNSN